MVRNKQGLARIEGNNTSLWKKKKIQSEHDEIYLAGGHVGGWLGTDGGQAPRNGWSSAIIQYIMEMKVSD